MISYDANWLANTMTDLRLHIATGKLAEEKRYQASKEHGCSSPEWLMYYCARVHCDDHIALLRRRIAQECASWFTPQ